MKRKPLILFTAAALAALASGAFLMDASPLAAVRQGMTALQNEADQLIAACKDGMTQEASDKVKTIHDKIDRLRETEALLEKQADNARHLSSVPAGERPELSLELDGVTGEDAKAVRNFSITKMMFAKLTGDVANLTPAERHIMAMANDEAIRNGITLKGFGIPASALKSLRFSNDMTATGGSLLEGGNTIRKDYRELIGPLADQSVLAGLGVTIFENLRGNVEFPVITALSNSGAYPATKTETGNADELTATTSVKNMSPRRLPAVVDVTDQMLRQDSIGMRNFIIGDLTRQFGVVVDNMALNGSGSSNQPTGLLGTAGIGAVAIGTNGGAPTWGKVVELETKVDVANAAMGRLAYLTSKNGKGVLKTTQRVSGQSQMLWEDDKINGYGAAATNLIGSAGTKGSGTALTSLAFGNWADLILGFWGGVDIVGVRDRAQAIAGTSSIVMEGFYDILVRRAASFAACTDMNSV